jgi:hypothetical protein
MLPARCSGSLSWQNEPSSFGSHTTRFSRSAIIRCVPWYREVVHISKMLGRGGCRKGGGLWLGNGMARSGEWLLNISSFINFSPPVELFHIVLRFPAFGPSSPHGGFLGRTNTGGFRLIARGVWPPARLSRPSPGISCVLPHEWQSPCPYDLCIVYYN